MISRKINFSLVLTICSLILFFCASCTVDQYTSQEIETLTDTPIWTPSVNLTPMLFSDAVVNTEETDEVIPPGFELQELAAQNIKQIAPIAILQDDAIYSSTISPDGKWLARNTSSGVHVYEVDSGEKIASLITNSFVYKSVFSDDGTRLAIISVRSSSPDVVTIRTDASNPYRQQYDVTVWQITDQKVLFTKPYEELCGDGNNVDLFQFLDDNSLVLNSINADTYVQRVCRVSGENGDVISQLELNPSYGYVRHMALSTDGQILSSVFSSDTMSYQNPRMVNFSFPNGNVLLDKNVEEMSTVAFIPQSQNLVYTAGKAAENISLEQITSDGIVLKSFPLPPASDWPLPITVNQQYVTVSYHSRGVLVFDVNTGEEIKQIVAQANQITYLNDEGEFDGFSRSYLARDKNRLLIHQICMNQYNGETTSLRVVDLPIAEETVFSFDIPAESLGDLSPNGAYVAKGGFWNGEIHVWNTNNGQLARVIAEHRGPVNQVVFSPDSVFLASASRDTDPCLWDVNNGELVHTFSGHQGEVLRIAFSTDGTRLMTSSRDNTLRLWNVETGEEIRKFENPVPEGDIKGVWFTSDHTVLVNNIPDYGNECNGCHARTFLLNIDTGEFTEQPWNWLRVYQSLAGDWLLRYGVTPDTITNLGRIVEGQFQSEKILPLTQFNDSNEIALSADGQWIYSLNANGLHVFNRSSGEQVDLAANYLDAQTYGNGHLESSADGRFLVDFTWDKITLWGVPE